MKWLKKHLQIGNTIKEQVDQLDLKGKKSWIAFIYSFIITIILAIPFILLFLAFFFVYSPVLWFYWVGVSLASILLIIGNAFSGTLYLKLLSNYYTEHLELQDISYFSFMIREIIHPFSLFILILFNAFFIFVL